MCPPETFNDKELKRLLKGCLPMTVVDTGLGASEKVGRKDKKMLDPVAKAAFWEWVSAVSGHFLVNNLLLMLIV